MLLFVRDFLKEGRGRSCGCVFAATLPKFIFYLTR